jgi:hypothetical protein
MFVLFPLLLVSLGIHFKERSASMIGLILFYLLGLSQLTIDTIQHIEYILFLSLLVLFPSILLLISILDERYGQQLLKDLLKNKKSVIVVSLVFLCFVFLMYMFMQIGSGLLSLSTQVQAQVLIIAGVSLLLFTPFLLRHTGVSEENKV